MITRCLDKNKLPLIQSKLEQHFLEVPYLYANVQKYGVGNDNIQLWTDESEGEINGIYLKYYECMHFFTDNTNYPKDEFIRMILNHSPKVIMLEDSFGKKVESELIDTYYPRPEYIVELKPEQSGTIVDDVLEAKESDFEEITDLLMSDPVYSEVYNRDELINQLLERYRDGFGKAYVIKRDNRIVTAYIINGECDQYYVLGGLITHSDYRHKGLGQRILNHVLRELNATKTCLGFLLADNVATIELHKKMGMNMEHFLRKYYIK